MNDFNNDFNNENKPISHRRKRGYYLYRIIFVLAVVVFVIAAVNIAKTIIGYHSADSSYTKLKNEFIDETTSDTDTEDYDWIIKMHEEYPDIVGWISIDGTNVDYPIMHHAGSDGDSYYLHTDYSGSYSVNGSIFIEALNSADLNDAYTVIYGHNMKSGAMFHDIIDYKDAGFYDEHPIIKVLVPVSDEDGERVEIRTYSIFSYHIINADNQLYSVGYELGSVEYANLISAMYSGAYYDTGVSADEDSKTITLSTCTSANDDTRAVVHAVLTGEETWAD